MSYREMFGPARIVLASYWASAKWILLLTAAIIVLSSLASVAAPYVFSRIIDRMNGGIHAETLVLGFLLYAGLMGLSHALDGLTSALSYITSQSLMYTTSVRFFDRILKKTPVFFVTHNPAEVQNANGEGASSLAALIQLVLVVFIPGIMTISFSLSLLGAIINWQVTLIVFVYGALLIGLTWYINQHTSPLLYKTIDETQANASFVGNAFTAMETLRQFGSERWMAQTFTLRAKQIWENWRRYCFYQMGAASVFGLMLCAQIAVTFVLLLPRYQNGELSVGDIVLFNTMLLNLSTPFQMIGNAIDDLFQMAARFRPFATLWLADEEYEPENHRALRVSEGHIAFDAVSFQYSGGRGIKGVTFTAERGRITYIVGETGAGKSTVFKLLLKSLAPDAGRVMIDGTNLADVSRADWFAHVGVVPQDIALLNNTLVANIVLGREFDTQRLNEAARKAEIFDFITALPDGFETNVGERGLKLSGGERQRIAIARALYADPAVLLLDEASSALDEATERDIMERIRGFSDRVTVLAITHRKSVIRGDDRVVAL
ncbi:ABC transporter ATP-binding protein [Rhizobium sp. CFBP 8762]|uniref:ABC transporter ATP-binding protein n=1 Tax=Rhizobium sp. CFBP 8762 TaxID=2775279 RepID=UPI00177FB425|nr:ABC transporter ATP-binding protein [Rhizobium sp. CFBP 8762]MBD8553211.1 ABC transporter ATP-binding protein [Rhizobium sp. CFBP 8762]